VGEDALVTLADKGGELTDGLVVVPPQRLAPLVVLVLDEPPHLKHVTEPTVHISNMMDASALTELMWCISKATR
jgi:hypothetical protein